MRFGDFGVGGWVMVAALGLVGCAATTSGEDDVTVVEGAQGRSGERLSAMVYRAGEAEQFRHFHDELLGFDCQFGVDAAGTPRCFPVDQDQVSYLDPQCQEPAVQRYYLEPGDWFVEWDVTVACPGVLEPHGEAYQVGGEVYAAPSDGSPDYELYTRDEYGCHPGGGEAKSASPVYRLLRTPASELVAGRVERLETNAGLKVDRVISDDGAQANLGVRLHDGTACQLQRDGTCMGFGSFQAQCPAPRSSAGTSGAELLDVGPGPLHLELYELASAGGALRVPDGNVGYFLTARGTTCQVTSAADGSLRCLDENDEVEESDYFADAACEQRLFRSKEQSLGDRSSTELVWIERGIDYRIERVIGVGFHRGALYRYTKGGCQLESSFIDEPLLALREELGFEALPRVEDARLP